MIIFLIAFSLLIQEAILKMQITNKPSCHSIIYCHGKLLDTVQRAGLYDDSKTFVDLKMKKSVRETMQNFNRLMKFTNDKPNKMEVQEFVNGHFEEGDELQKWFPEDFQPRPRFLQQVQGEQMRQFAIDLIELWPSLARKVKPDVADFPEKYSLIPVPHGSIVPGGRFREFYYWDSYWIIKTLLRCEMIDTARGMIENFMSMVQKYGFIPNGGRIYYLDRSQPPLLAMMAADYYETTKDKEWLRNNIRHLDTELNFWLKKRTRTIKVIKVNYTVAHYLSLSGTPRPESYIEDIETASYYNDENAQIKCYSEIKAGAESGWDFTSRWIFDKHCGMGVDLSQIQTSRIIPVELNAYLYKSFRIIAKFYSILGDWERAFFWRKKAAEWLSMISKILWDEDDGIWYDFDTKLKCRRKFFFASNLAPLWLQTFEKHNTERITKRVVAYIKRNRIMTFPGGVPSSLANSGEQWDFPNAWAPCQVIVIQALERTQDPEAVDMASALARKWVNSNFKAYQSYGVMYEKYDASQFGERGGGGEYVVQSGFGWTNAIALELIYDYYTNITRKPYEN